MKVITVYPNSAMDTYSLQYCSPSYPLLNSMDNVKVYVWDLPPIIEEKVALLRLIKPGDEIPDIGVRHERYYNVYVPDDYEL